MREFRDYYSSLGINRNSSDEDIKRAYKALVKKYHPDINKGNEESCNIKMKEINEAYHILKNYNKRQNYNKWYDDIKNTNKKYESTSNDFSNKKENNDTYNKRRDYTNNNSNENKKTNFNGFTNNKEKNNKNNQANDYYNNSNDHKSSNNGNSYEQRENYKANNKSQDSNRKNSNINSNETKYISIKFLSIIKRLIILISVCISMYLFFRGFNNGLFPMIGIVFCMLAFLVVNKKRMYLILLLVIIFITSLGINISRNSGYIYLNDEYRINIKFY